MIDAKGLDALVSDSAIAIRNSLLRELVEAGQQLLRCELELARGMQIGDEEERAARARRRWDQAANRARRLTDEGNR